jgi:RNA 3'-terminal phosphate cyclase (ATP)/RNA 3'-terminal phosphate cyclase (GTP)
VITIDGAYGAGGGQMLRTALGLSAETGKPFRMVNIRAGRPKGGLAEQHLQAVRATAAICGAEVKGAELHSRELHFSPGRLSSGTFRIPIRTAGSVGLVLQSLLIPATRLSLTLHIEGGATYGKFAMPVHHMQRVLMPLVEKMGWRAEVEVDREGFYPKGGARARVECEPGELRPLVLDEAGRILAVKGISIAHRSLEGARVAHRQAEAACQQVRAGLGMEASVEVRYVEAVCPGSGIQLWAETERSLLGGNSLGERGKPSEEVGREAAVGLVDALGSGAVDPHTADQLMPYLALAGGGSYTTHHITDHVTTNAYVIEHFLPVAMETLDGRVTCRASG